MTDARFLIEWAGPSTTIQDRGRPGFLRYGVSASGPMDRTGMAAAAALAGVADPAAIEIGLGGLRLMCEHGEAGFAIAGGAFSVMLDGRSLGSATVGRIAAGSRLSIAPGAWGCWTYLVFAGALDARRWLGSRSTHAPSGLGGGVLRSGARLTVAIGADGPPAFGDASWPARHPGPDRFRLVMGPQETAFAPAARQALLSAPFTISRRFDRMGVGLEGPPLTIARTLDMPSEPILRGSIQAPGDGEPVVLMADHQPTGGYPKIATLIGADQDAFAQRRPGEKVRFMSVTAEEAVAIARGMPDRVSLAGRWSAPPPRQDR